MKKSLFKKFISLRQHIILAVFLILWAAVIILKQGGQSLLIHYLWPFITLVSLIFLFSKKWLKNKVSLLHILIFLALAAFLLTFLFDQSPSNGSLELMNISGGLLLILILSQMKWSQKLFDFLFIRLIGIVLFIDIWGFITYASGHPFNRLAGPLMKPNEAFSGFPNLLANLNLLVLLPAFYFLNKNKNKWIGIGLYLINGLIVSGLILSYSRAALLSAAIVLLIAGIIYGITLIKKKQKILKSLLNIVVVLLIGLVLSTTINAIRGVNQEAVSVQEKITFQSEDEGSSVSERIASVERGLDMAVENPVFGVGAGSFNYISQSYEENFETLSSYPYSLPIKILAEHGFIAFFLILASLILILIFALKTNSKLTIVPALTLIILLLHHTLDNNFDFFAASFPLFILFGMIWPETKQKSVIKNGFILAIIALVCVSGVVFAVHEGWYGRYYIEGRNAAGALDHEAGYNGYLKANKLIFPRDAQLAAANSAWELYKENGDEDWLTSTRENAFTYFSNYNPLDSRGPLLITQTFIEQNNYSGCIKMAREAKIIGGENNFEADYYELICLKNTTDPLTLYKFISQLEKKLYKYFELLEVNAHMTVLTDNPKFAIKILDELRNYDSKYKPLYQDMYNLAVLELEKFHSKYGIEAEIEL